MTNPESLFRSYVWKSVDFELINSEFYSFDNNDWLSNSGEGYMNTFQLIAFLLSIFNIAALMVSNANNNNRNDNINDNQVIRAIHFSEHLFMFFRDTCFYGNVWQTTE